MEVSAAGIMPVTRLSPGDYEALMSYADGNRGSRSLRVESGGSASVSFTYVPRGILAVSTDLPGARVFISGVERGQAPLTLRGLDPGYLEVLWKREGYEDASQQKRIEAGKMTVVAFVLKKATPQAPPGAALASGGFVRIPAGTFTIGSPASEKDRDSDVNARGV